MQLSDALTDKCQGWTIKVTANYAAKPHRASALNSYRDAIKRPQAMMASRVGECICVLELDGDPLTALNWGVDRPDRGGVDLGVRVATGDFYTINVKQTPQDGERATAHLITSKIRTEHLPGPGADIYYLVQANGTFGKRNWTGGGLGWVWREEYIKNHEIKVAGVGPRLDIGTPYYPMMNTKLIRELRDLRPVVSTWVVAQAWADTRSVT